MSRETCLVIGGSGFIGTHLCQSLLAQGCQVHILSRKLDLNFSSDKIRVFRGNLEDSSSLRTAMEGCNVVYHLASSTIPSTSNLDPQADIRVNLEGSINLIEVALQLHISKLIFASSGGTVYGIQESMPISENTVARPICSYGIVKLAVEKYLHMYHALYGLDYCVLRIANPFGEGQKYGRGQGIIANSIIRSLLGENIEIWGDGSIIRDYIYISDVINALLKARHYSGKHKVINIGTGVGRSVVEVIDAIEQVLNCSIQRVYKSSRNLDVPENILDISLAKAQLGWQPEVSWLEGLRRTYLWAAENYKK